MKLKTRTDFRTRRHHRVRRKVRGTAERPRMSVFISGKHMYVQFVDDAAEVTVASASTGSKSFSMRGKNTLEAAKELGRVAAEAAKEKGVSKVVFDRGGFSYAGRVKAIAEAAREVGLEF